MSTVMGFTAEGYIDHLGDRITRLRRKRLAPTSPEGEPPPKAARTDGPPMPIKVEGGQVQQKSRICGSEWMRDEENLKSLQSSPYPQLLMTLLSPCCKPPMNSYSLLKTPLLKHWSTSYIEKFMKEQKSRPSFAQPLVKARSHDDCHRKLKEALLFLSQWGGDDQAVRAEEFNVGGETSVVVLSVNKSHLCAIWGMASKWMDVPAPTLPVEPPGCDPHALAARTLGTFAKLEDAAFISRQDEAQIVKEVGELLAWQSVDDAQEYNDFWTMKDVLDYRPTSSTRKIIRFQNQCLTPFAEFCPKGTDVDCERENVLHEKCEKIHFHRLIFEHTDIEMGDCSYLDTCRKMSQCRCVHYKLQPSKALAEQGEAAKVAALESGHGLPLVTGPILTSAYKEKPLNLALGLPTMHWQNDYQGKGSGREKAPIKPLPIGMNIRPLTPAQWVLCDIRNFDMTRLGKFDVIMADPPWDIHMELPYGTMTDDEMREMRIGNLSDHGLIFLWVTGRAMELGRECLEIWGYQILEEIAWVKINQLQRVIRTGRTGHWLNHSKEHCLVGIKGRPKISAGIDSDVIVCEVRETSRKPDEIYAMIERICPDGRKLEIFARDHNIHDGWAALGNQLANTTIEEPWARENYNEWVEAEKQKKEGRSDLERAMASAA